MIFPVYFEAAPAVVTQDNSDYTATSSFVYLGSGVDVTLNDAEKVGTTVTFYCLNSDANATVVFATPLSTSFDTISLADNYTSATVMWTPSGWTVINLGGNATLN
jgi:hypothetical protein